MNKKDALKFGTLVEITAIAVPHYNFDNKRVITSVKINEGVRKGIIIGGKRLQEGHVEHDYCEGFDEGTFFVSEKSIFVYLVSFGFMNKPAFVFPEDIRVICNADNFSYLNYYPIEYKYPYFNSYYDDKARKELRDAMKTVPRDSKGRWK